MMYRVANSNGLYQVEEYVDDSWVNVGERFGMWMEFRTYEDAQNMIIDLKRIEWQYS